MTLSISIDRLNKPIHLAKAGSVGPCAFTANRLGYGVLMKWAQEVARGEDIEFNLPSLARYGRLLADWLKGQGQVVRVMA